MENHTSNEYRTGGHLPRGSGNSLLSAGLLVFFAITGMFLTAGFLTLRALSTGAERELATLTPPDTTLYPGDHLHMEGEVTDFRVIGITCQSISAFCEKYYELPPGLYILQVEKGSPAQRQGVLPGDVLVRVNGQALRLPSSLQNVFDMSAGKPVALEFSRNGNTYTIYVAPGA
ncbi:MAG: PDZ domain-containing protein [Ruminococcaceae bacterium]|nr:PDZ domain-containing protein [Oscillospiraceae bacterium]